MEANLYWQQSVKCEFCDENFETEDALKLHLRLHSRRKPYKCDECNAKFSYNSTLEWHKRIHKGDLPFKCDQCEAQFPYNSILVWHKRKHRVAEISQNASLVGNVGNTYSDQQESLQHTLPQGVIAYTNTPNMQAAATPPASYSEMVLCPTNSSGSIAPTHDTLNVPVPSQAVVPAVPSHHQVGPSAGGGKRKLESEDGAVRCDVCGAVLPCGRDLKAHMQTKHNMGENNPFNVLSNQQQQETNGEYVQRKKIVVEKPYKCDLCGAGFNTEGHLDTHRQRHVVKATYGCEKCGLAFYDEQTLESHKRRHQNERPYKCERCGAGFFRESHLHTHIKRHTGELI